MQYEYYHQLKCISYVCRLVWDAHWHFQSQQQVVRFIINKLSSKEYHTLRREWMHPEWLSNTVRQTPSPPTPPPHTVPCKLFHSVPYCTLVTGCCVPLVTCMGQWCTVTFISALLTESLSSTFPLKFEPPEMQYQAIKGMSPCTVLKSCHTVPAWHIKIHSLSPSIHHFLQTKLTKRRYQYSMEKLAGDLCFYMKVRKTHIPYNFYKLLALFWRR